MPERLVLCGGLSSEGTARTTLQIDVRAPTGSPARINLRVDDLSARLADNLPDVFTDLLEIAVYVYCADQFTKRGDDSLPRMGAGWRRSFRLRIPVRRPDVWTRPEILTALGEMLGFLAEDTYVFEFVPASHAQPLQSYLSFDDPDAQIVRPEEVVLFSGGLDSLAGAVDALFGASRRVALVSHRSSKFVTSKQNALVGALRLRTPPRSLIHIPVTVNKGSGDATEFTQRTRSFLFATLGFIVARMFGLRELSFYENGIVSINLPVAGDVVGSRASRTTHPQALAGFERLFSLLIDQPFFVPNPYLLKTKGEVVRVLADRGAADLIPETLSCAGIRRATQTQKHCGVCSQCLSRRFGILAAGQGAALEPSSNYAVELFRGDRKPGPGTTMAVSYVEQARSLATISMQTFTARHGEVFRVLSLMPGELEENLRAVWQLHSRHGAEVVSVFEAEFAQTATIAGQLSLAPTSLLALVTRPSIGQPTPRDPAESEEPASVQAAADRRNYRPSRIQFAIDHHRTQVLFEGDVTLGGATYRLFASLIDEFREDLDAGRDAEDHRFVAAGDLAERLGIDYDSARQRVRHTRAAIAQRLCSTSDRTLGLNAIIETNPGRGYRLNPDLVLVLPQQLRDAGRRVSRAKQKSVTLTPSGH